MENDVIIQVQNRIKSLLFDDNITQYREYEIFKSLFNGQYQFLIWKLQPLEWEQFSEEIRQLVKEKGYICIPGAWDVSTYNPAAKTGYKVIALYMPNET